MECPQPLVTRVSVIPRSGDTITTHTATHAQQWGELALVTLVGVEGVWTISVLSPATRSDIAADQQRST
jgi:hypothetical protein